MLALSPDGIATVERGIRRFGNKELARVGVWPGVGHGQPSGNVEGQRWRRFILVRKARPAGLSSSIAQRIAALNHESGDHAMKGKPIEEFVSILLCGTRIDVGNLADGQS